ncbi:MAG: hypothetical protein EBZ91_14635, partial [Gammaproteobacteria bacterium]|nr:hypothetical protein [Gammaproteobacteria bacterium]
MKHTFPCVESMRRVNLSNGRVVRVWRERTKDLLAASYDDADIVATCIAQATNDTQLIASLGKLKGVSGSGFKTATLDNQFLQLGDTGGIVVNVQPDGLAEVVIAANRVADPVFDSTRTGAGTRVAREQIEGLPSINRNIQDYVRTDPRIAQTDKERGEIS